MQFNRKFRAVRNKTKIMTLRRFVSLAKVWRTLNVAQRCYALATLLSFLILYWDMQNILTQVIVGVLILTAILHEFWPRFMLAWDSLPGKALILFVYAVIANFALASASGLVNSVSGVSAASLPYSHNFAIILMLPSWFFVTTLLALVVVQLLMPVYLIVLLVLKPFGIHGLWHAPEYRYVFTTALVRYIWMLIVLIKVAEISTVSGMVSLFDDSQNEVVNTLKSEIESGNEKLDPVEIAPQEGETDAEGSETLSANLSSHGEKFRLMRKQWLASFIFDFEADEFSRCTLPEGSKVVELNDYEILAITYSQDTELGYSYTVLPCQSAAIGVSIAP